MFFHLSRRILWQPGVEFAYLRRPHHMSRQRSGYYNAIEYIGPRPQKPKKTNFFGGWVIVVIALAAAAFFG